MTVTRFVPIPVFAGRDQTICSGMTINLVGESGFTNYSWQAITGGPILSGQTVAISPIETTEYEIDVSIPHMSISNRRVGGHECVMSVYVFHTHQSMIIGSTKA